MSLIFPKSIASKIGDSDVISISIQARTSKQIAELTRAQSIDFGFADASDDEAAENLYRSVEITADCPVAIPENHPLAKKLKSVSRTCTIRRWALAFFASAVG